MTMESYEKKIISVCRNCHNSISDDDNFYDTGAVNKCRKWLNNCSLSDDSSNAESVNSDSTTASAPDNFYDNAAVLKNENICTTDKIITKNDEDFVGLSEILNKKPNHYENIQIFKSQNVHIGDVTYINGPIYINHFAPTLNQNILINNNISTKELPIVSRRTWLAQPPLDPDDLKYYTQPAKFVIICHSASEEAYTQTDNNLLVRLIQQFHIESRKWNDISYNFLAGADGSIYEGRGWKIVGAHTLGYNSISIGICFIGCYMRKLPPPAVIKKVQALIKHGVEIGAIAEDYTLLGHRQCRSSESPGGKLFEELKTWDRWDGSITVLNPSPLVIE